MPATRLDNEEENDLPAFAHNSSTQQRPSIPPRPRILLMTAHQPPTPSHEVSLAAHLTVPCTIHRHLYHVTLRKIAMACKFRLLPQLTPLMIFHHYPPLTDKVPLLLRTPLPLLALSPLLTNAPLLHSKFLGVVHLIYTLTLHLLGQNHPSCPRKQTPLQSPSMQHMSQQTIKLY